MQSRKKNVPENFSKIFNFVSGLYLCMTKETVPVLDTVLSLYREKERYILLANHYLNDMEKAKDIVSDSFIYMLEHKETISGDKARIKGYLLQIVKHKCLNALKREEIKQNVYRNMYDIDISILSDDNVTRHIANSDIKAILRIAGSRMKDRTLEIYTSSRIKGLSHKELSKMYGMTVNHIAKEISKANKIIEMVIKNYLHVLLPVIIQIISHFANGGGRFEHF